MSSASIPGTNVPPVSFPGIVSGINYDAIIQKLTSLTLAPTTQLNNQLASLNAANSELIKINAMFQSLQNALGNLSDPGIFDSWNAVSSNTSVATAQGIPSATAVAGTYTIDSATVATATAVTSNTAAGHNITDALTSGTYAGQASDGTATGGPPLIDSYAAITPSNGSGGEGTITVDGQQIQYNVNGQSLNQILANIQTAVQANYDSSFTIVDTGGIIQVSGSKPITLGSATDQGNLLQVLKLDQAAVNNSGPGPYTVNGTSGVGGLDQGGGFNDATAENFVTPVTGGFFTINGVKINVSTTGDNLASVLAKINSSAAGVQATYDAATNQITLTSATTGPQSIVLGASGDTSNFLSAAGLTGAGATTTIGKQASVTVQNPSGTTSTIYSASNTITTAIPGISLNLTADATSPFTVSVSQNTGTAVTAINSFVSSYNAVVTEINSATRPPVVTQTAPGSTNQTAALGAGILWQNSDVTTIKNELTNMVSGFFGSGSSNYNSLSSIGLDLGDSFQVLTSGNNSDSTGTTGGTNSGTGSSGISQTTYEGTDGTLQGLNTATFLQALAADPSDVQAILTGANGLTNQLGSYLTSVTGSPTLLDSGPVGTLPVVSVMSGFEEQNSDNITSIQQQIAQITTNANMQADSLRSQFVNTETSLAEFQALQSQLGSFFKSAGS